jgi:N6-adenosine-specific RNA methylase IME4
VICARHWLPKASTKTQARTLGALSEEEFARAVSDARAAASRTLKRVVNAAAIEQKREQHRARIEQGGTVDDLIALAATGFRAGVIYIDPPWPFETYSDQGRQRSPDRHYGTMTLDEIKALPITRLTAPDCAVLMWVTWPHMPSWMPVLDAWDVTYSGLGFDWIKTTANGDGLHWGTGYNTRQNPEPCILARIGNPRRLNADVHSVIMAPVGAHSEKPEEVARRIERLFPGPYVELFARRPRDGWRTWGNELPAPTVTPADTVPSTATASADTNTDTTPITSIAMSVASEMVATDEGTADTAPADVARHKIGHGWHVLQYLSIRLV